MARASGSTVGARSVDVGPVAGVVAVAAPPACPLCYWEITPLDEGGNCADVLQSSSSGSRLLRNAWLLMIFAGIMSQQVGIKPFGYVTSMVLTIGLWLVVAPAAGAIAGSRGPAKPARV